MALLRRLGIIENALNLWVLGYFAVCVGLIAVVRSTDIGFVRSNARRRSVLLLQSGVFYFLISPRF